MTDRHTLIFTRTRNPARDILIRAFDGGEASHVGVRLLLEVAHACMMGRLSAMERLV